MVVCNHLTLVQNLKDKNLKDKNIKITRAEIIS